MSRRPAPRGPSLFAELDEPEPVPVHAQHRGPSLPYSNDSTSKAAALAAESGAEADRRRIYEYMAEAGGATCDECEVRLGLSHQTASARIRGLAQAGMIRDSGRKRLTRCGVKAIVWEALP